ncbi:MAG: hypothetical protein HZA49_01540 [Planctomycetes bacterium]|nr:hypothetical protein [Planctomycetota bacterium]
MKKISIFLAVCAASAMLVASPGYLRSGTDGPTAPKTYQLTLMDNKVKKIKAITPEMIQRGIMAPEEFTAYVTGKIDDLEITLIDANKNEAYDEKGRDAFIIGKSLYALPVSRVINIKNKLYECEIETGGEQITLTPYEGECGEVDMLSDFKCPLKPEMLILNTSDIYLDVSKGKTALVPCGSYSLWLGYIPEKKCSMAIKAGEMKSIEIVKGEDKDGKKKSVKVQWGAPYKLDCSCSIQDNNVSIPESVSVYGSAGEEYCKFSPSILPATVEIFDAGKKSVAKGAINRTVPGNSQNNISEIRGGYNGTIKKGAEGPYTLKIHIKNSVLGELKGEKQIP